MNQPACDRTASTKRATAFARLVTASYGTWSIATDKNDAVWLGYAADGDDLNNTGDVVIVKLAP